MKVKILFLLIIVFMLTTAIISCKRIEQCIRNYSLDIKYRLNLSNKDDLKLVQKFNVIKICSNGEKPEEIWIKKPEYVDDSYEKIIYCKDDFSFLVVKGHGIVGEEFYFFEGKPCK